jgi:hypothetical protein
MTCQNCGVEGDHVQRYDDVTVLGGSLPLCPMCHHQQMEWLNAYRDMWDKNRDRGNENSSQK